MNCDNFESIMKLLVELENDTGKASDLRTSKVSKLRTETQCGNETGKNLKVHHSWVERPFGKNIII